MEGLEDIEIVEPSKPRKRRKPATTTIFRRDVWMHKLIPELRECGPRVAEHAILSTAYFVPIRLLVHLAIRTKLYDVLTARPKSKKFQGKETRVPWPLYHERGDWVAVPRQFGVQVFGLPKQIQLSDGLPVNLTCTRPLFNAETCKRSKGIDQETAVAAVEAYMRREAQEKGFASCIFAISPGYGKTCCSAHIIQRLGRRALFIVPNEHPFLKQVADEMRNFLGDSVRVGKLVTSDKRNWDIEDKDIVIATAKSAATIRYDLTSFGTVVVDEGHEMATSMYSQMFFRFNARFVLVLTATPERAADHCGGYLQWLAGPVVWHEKRDVSKIRWGGVGVTIYNVRYRDHPIKEVLLKSGEPYWEGMTRQIIAKHCRNRFMLEQVIVPRHRAGRRILILGTRVEHMEHIHRELNTRYNIETGIIVGAHTDGRKVTGDMRAAAQKMPILVATTSIVCKALNIPKLDTLVILSGGSFCNATFWEQCSGRVTRDCDDKQKPEIVLIRDCYLSKVRPGTDGVFAACVDGACHTLRKLSSEGYSFETIEVEI